MHRLQVTYRSCRNLSPMCLLCLGPFHSVWHPQWWFPMLHFYLGWSADILQRVHYWADLHWFSSRVMSPVFVCLILARSTITFSAVIFFFCVARSQDKSFCVEGALNHIFTRSLPFPHPGPLICQTNLDNKCISFRVPEIFVDKINR